jgi:UDP-glucose 4-epimerase
MSALHPSSSGTKSGLVVVLGGLGFIGSHICRELVARSFRVRIFDKLYSSHALVEDIKPYIEIVEGDISRLSDVLRATRDASTVIHLIHTTVPGSSMDDPSYDITSNVVASVKWLSHLAETRIRRILYFSSGGTVYGIPCSNPIDENHPTNPISSYGITKLAIEKYLAIYASLYGIEHYILRPSNVYGPGQQLDIGQGVIGVMARHALRGEPIEIWGTGEAIRDYLYIDDMVTATMVLLAYEGPHRIFNVSGGEGYSLLDIIAILSSKIGSLTKIHKPDRGFDVPMNVLDSSRICTEIGWRPQIPLEEGIARTIKWLTGVSK